MTGKYKPDRAAQARIRAALQRSIADAAEALAESANRTVPHEIGTLERSAKVTMDRSTLAAAVSYDTPYAVRQHEDTRLRHKSKGRAKWLKLTLIEDAARIRGYVAESIRRSL